MANYLNTTESMFDLLNSMNESGYEVSGIPDNSSILMDMLQAQGINVGSWAPGVLNEMVENKTEWGGCTSYPWRLTESGLSLKFRRT